MKPKPWEQSPPQPKKEAVTEQREKPTNDPSTGRFVKGGGGRPKGSKNKATVAIENMLEGEAEAITRRCIDLAKKGDPTAMKIVMDRLAPVRKGRPLQGLSRREGENSVEALLRSVLDGELTTEEGKDVVSMVESAARVATNKALTELRQKQIETFQEGNIDPNRVMIVPALTDPDSWSAHAVESQEILKQTVKE